MQVMNPHYVSLIIIICANWIPLEKSLKKRLEILKKRAKEIQALYRARHGIIDSVEDDPRYRDLLDAGHPEPERIGSDAITSAACRVGLP